MARDFDAKPPRLFGAYRRMPILIAMVQNGGFIRRADIAQSGRNPLDDAITSDKSGLLLPKWQYRDHRYITAFNPEFPLLKETLSLLRALARYYPSNLRNVVPRADRVYPKKRPQRIHNIDYLFGSPTRTQTLAVLEALGGKAWQNRIHRGVPGQANASVKNVVAYFISEGVIEKQGHTIRFRQQPWLGQLRRLLRAYLKMRNEFCNMLAKEATTHLKPQRGQHKLDLLASLAVQRCLIVLAKDGPMGPMHLFAKARVVTADGTLDIFQREGIIAIQRRHRARLISLNAAYPVYCQFRGLLLRIGGFESDTAGTRSDLAVVKRTFSPRRLFTSEMRSEILIIVNACERGAISASSIRRLLPEYDASKLRSALQRFVRQGIVRSRREGGERLYSLNPRYPFARDLKVLLDAVADHWPSYRTIARIADRLKRPRGRPRSLPVESFGHIGATVSL